MAGSTIGRGNAARLEWVALGSLVVAAMALRFLGLEKSLWLDEYFSVAAITNPSLATLRQADKPPLYFLLLWAWSSLGQSDAMLRLFSVLVSGATLTAVALWLRKFGFMAAFLGVALFGSLPILLRYGQEVRGYGLIILLTVGAFSMATALAREPALSRRSWSIGIILALAVATHLIGVFLVGALLVYVFTASPRKHWPLLLRKNLVGVIFPPFLVFCFFYFFFLQGVVGAEAWWVSELGVAQVRQVVWALVGGSALEAVLVGGGPADSWVSLATAAILAAGLVLPIFIGSRVGWPFLAAALVYWGQLIVFSFIGRPIFLYRTALPALVPFLAAVALGASLVRGWRRSILALAVVCLCSLHALGWSTGAAWQPYESWSDVGALVAEEWRPGDIVLVYPEYTAGVVAHYLPDEVSQTVRPLSKLDPMDQELFESSTGAFFVVRLDTVSRREIAELDRFSRRLRQQVGRFRWEEARRNLVVTRFTR